MLSFESTLAFRHLRSGGGQTLLTVFAVATGVVVVIFISSLIFGIRAHISELLTDILPQVTVTVAEREPIPLARAPGGSGRLSTSRIERQSRQRKQIENWEQAERTIRRIPGVVMVAPAVFEQGFVSRGGKRLGAQINAADPQRLNVVLPVTKYLIEGHYLDLTAEEVVVNYKLLQELGAKRGDRVRITSNEGLSDSFRIVGVYDTGQDEDRYLVYITLRAGQSLFATGTGVRTLLVKADDLFHADAVADRIMAVLPYEAKSWSRQYPQFVASLGAYDATAYLVSAFSLVATGFAIASVLIVSVLQKGKQIGILKSIGAKRRQILTVFLLEGLGIALVGAGAGALLGCGLVRLLDRIKQPVTRYGATPESLFPSELTWQLVAAAILAAVVSTVIAALLPARRAAHLNPVEAMR